MKKIFIICITILTIGFTANAQLSLGPIWKLNYDVGIPMGQFSSDFISKAGWRGFSVKANWFVAENLTVGGVTGWNGFYEKDPRDTYTTDNEALTATRMKYTYTLPLLASVQYVMADLETVNPYVSLAMGPYFIQQEDQAGRFMTSNENWRFGFNPEVGVMVPFNIDVGLNASVGYNHIFYNVAGIDNIGYLTVSVGLYFN